MNFLYACDDHYAPYAGVSITSLFENNKELDEITVYVLVNGVSRSNEQKFAELAEEYGRNIALIDASEIDKYLSDNNLLPFGTAGSEAYFRLFCNRVLPEHVERVVYLDCDTIVFGGVQELDNIRFDDNTCCALVRGNRPNHYNKYIGLNEDELQFQSAPLIIDFGKWEKCGIEKRITKLFEQGITYMRTHDMDILSLTAHRNTETIPVKFSVMCSWTLEDMEKQYKSKKLSEAIYYSQDEMANAINNPVILDFCGEKPWSRGNRVPQNDIWEKYKLMSRWKDIPQAEFTLGFMRKCNFLVGRLLPKSIFRRIDEGMHKRFVERYYFKHDHFAKLERYNEAIRKMEGDI